MTKLLLLGFLIYLINTFFRSLSFISLACKGLNILKENQPSYEKLACGIMTPHISIIVGCIGLIKFFHLIVPFWVPLLVAKYLYFDGKSVNHFLAIFVKRSWFRRCFTISFSVTVVANGKLPLLQFVEAYSFLIAYTWSPYSLMKEGLSRRPLPFSYKSLLSLTKCTDSLSLSPFFLFLKSIKLTVESSVLSLLV